MRYLYFVSRSIMSFNNDQVIGICGAAWGDEGKGKFTDEFAASADLVVRAQGGCNAGHTVVIDDVKLKLHHVPSGIAHPGTINVIGNGVVLDPRVLIEKELAHLRDKGIDASSLRISGDIHLIMPWHRIIDKAREWSLGRNKIGTTARGIGPTYADKINRTGVRVNDLHDCSYFRERLNILAREKEQMIFGVFGVPRETFEEWMNEPDQENGAWHTAGGFNVDAIADSYCAWSKVILPCVTDTRRLVHDAFQSGKKILLEGAQGLLLDIDHGTYPFVTSSNCCAGGFATGAGLPPQVIDRVYNIMSAYMTRVGGGPFPTELGTEEQIAQEHADARMSFEESRAVAQQTQDDYSLGKVIRHIAGEFGTTTGRPRRTGWFDSVATSMAVKINGPDVIISKFDVLDVMPVIRICTAYTYTGPDTAFNGQTLLTGSLLTEFPTDARILQFCVPGEYAEFEGWQSDTTAITSYDDLPALAKTYLAGITQHSGCIIRKVSVGPCRNQTITL
jgi:adenylosuccinate synthase